MTLALTPRGLRALGHILPCAIGRGGLTGDKREGDLATPRGTWRVTGLFYRPDRLAPPAPWARPIRPGDLWSDAPEDPAYNSLVRAPHAPSHEALRRADPMYDIILTTDWNDAAVPGCGSAIFIHRWRRPRWPTAGCIALAPGDLAWLAARAAPGTAIRV
ncbi:L,D-transpeptidase family protein [Pseudoroseicyclus aestuarii]|uniref:L,D-transpeptidase-like protein n=1 Tax=Pseudoroseicyclus aestuarii TaxID=1795041 RepID=A0A318SQP3_9RHOB|nr:L,D-transpeptidase family protein [Pseudoroseicyclus aestuarii]PYE84231.1 L,D-transpeptidase-like protein [Pseudoroseicyclus aestuarii]